MMRRADRQWMGTPSGTNWKICSSSPTGMAMSAPNPCLLSPLKTIDSPKARHGVEASKSSGFHAPVCRSVTSSSKKRRAGAFLVK